MYIETLAPGVGLGRAYSDGNDRETPFVQNKRRDLTTAKRKQKEVKSMANDNKSIYEMEF